MEYFVISAKFVPLKYYTLSSQLRRLTSFSVGLFGSTNSVTRSYPVMRKSCIYFASYTIIPDRVMRMRKQSGVRRILKVYKERARVRSEYTFAKVCQK